eukprot:SAG31_NODE_82_length_27046_cov_45.857275_1_plen_58_part_00
MLVVGGVAPSIPEIMDQYSTGEKQLLHAGSIIIRARGMQQSKRSPRSVLEGGLGWVL